MDGAATERPSIGERLQSRRYGGGPEAHPNGERQGRGDRCGGASEAVTREDMEASGGTVHEAMVGGRGPRVPTFIVFKKQLAMTKSTAMFTFLLLFKFYILTWLNCFNIIHCDINFYKQKLLLRPQHFP